MVEGLKPLQARYLDELGRHRLHLINQNFATIFENNSRNDLMPDFTLNKSAKLTPKFDIIFADLGYNIEQLETIEGLSYMSTSLSPENKDVLDMRYNRERTSITAEQIVSSRMPNPRRRNHGGALIDFQAIRGNPKPLSNSSRACAASPNSANQNS